MQPDATIIKEVGPNKHKRVAMEYSLRETKPEDIQTVIELLKVCNLYYEEDDTPEKLAGKLTIDKDLMIVAEVSSKVVGFVMASYDKWAAIVWHLGVLPEWRGYGVGRALEQEIEKRLKGRGADARWGLVEVNNSRMLKMLPTLGLKTYSTVYVIGKKL